MLVLFNTMVVIILQYVCVSNQHIVHLKLTVICQLYLNKPGKIHVTAFFIKEKFPFLLKKFPTVYMIIT